MSKSLFKKIKQIVIGKARNPLDRQVFHRLSLIAFFAWVGLGADGLSSSCYGPEEAFLALGQYRHLSVFVALAAAFTVLIISASYSQIIELFPTGGGGYLVASKLLSPTVGMISGCALLVDYVLTISISIASGADAIFSFLPPGWHAYRLDFAVFGVLLLTVLNMRGVKDSVIPLVPVFLLFVVTHAFVIIFSLVTHWFEIPSILSSVSSEVHAVSTEVGFFGLLFLILRAYSLGAGTYTGIEAVCNGLPILREPKVETGKITMTYMSISLATTAAGFIMAYLFFHLSPVPGKTLNAVLFETLSKNWGSWGQYFVWICLISEAALLFVAAQAGFLDGPRILSNMAIDRWVPARFASLSDRLVHQNGILLMSAAALLTMILTQGSVRLLVVLYSINVFVDFCLSQLGMVRHWWKIRKNNSFWWRKGLINGIGLILTTFILLSVVFLKFHDGGWVTLLITGTLVMIAFSIKRHYFNTLKLLRRLDQLVDTVSDEGKNMSLKSCEFDPKAKTAVLMVNGFNGLGLHTLFGVKRLFGREFKNFVFVEIGVIDAGSFKGVAEMKSLEDKIKSDIDRYVAYVKAQGYYADGFTAVGIDIMTEAEKIAPQILEKYPNAVFFGGQLVFPKESIFTRWLHNYTVFALQKRFYQVGIPFVILPIRV